MIRNKAVVNEDTSGNVVQLQAEIKRLKITIEKLRTQCEWPVCYLVKLRARDYVGGSIVNVLDAW